MNSDIVNLNNLLLLTIGFMSGYSLWRLLQTRPSQRDWIVVYGLVLVAGAIGYFLFPQVAGYWITGVWIILFLIPLLGTRLTNHFTRTQQYRRAYRAALILQWFHPTKNWRESSALYRAIDLSSQGKVDEAARILERAPTSSTTLSRAATCELYRMRGQWTELRRWLEDEVPAETLTRESNLTHAYLLALEETGDLNRMLAFVDHNQPALKRSHVLDTARMVCLAYGGRKEALLFLFSSSLAGLSEPLKQSWLAIADFAAGQSEEGTARLTQLLSQDDHLLRRSAERKLAHPPVVAATVLTSESQAILDRIEREQIQEERFHDRPHAIQGKAYATYSLIALNIAVFFLEELAGGSENLQVLYQLGAFSQPAIARGEIWRMLTSTFLHYGLAHLAFNVLALYFIGPFVEYWLGIRRYFFTYFAAGLGGAVLTLLFSDPREIVVGASGCVMGLIGASAAIHLRGWRTERAPAARKELLELALFIAIQTVFDIVVPGISFTGHLGGLITGFIIGRILAPTNPLKAMSKLTT